MAAGPGDHGRLGRPRRGDRPRARAAWMGGAAHRSRAGLELSDRPPLAGPHGGPAGGVVRRFRRGAARAASPKIRRGDRVSEAGGDHRRPRPGRRRRGGRRGPERTRGRGRRQSRVSRAGRRYRSRGRRHVRRARELPPRCAAEPSPRARRHPAHGAGPASSRLQRAHHAAHGDRRARRPRRSTPPGRSSRSRTVRSRR